MSAKTLADLEAAILAHHRDGCEPDSERASAVLTGWVVGYEISNVVQVESEDGSTEAVIGFANDYISSDSSPNLTANLARWTADSIHAVINGGFVAQESGSDD